MDLTPNEDPQAQNWSLMSPSVFKNWEETIDDELQLPVSVVPLPQVLPNLYSN